MAKWFSEWQRAEKLLTQAVAIRDDAVSLFFMADFLETENRLDEAEEYYCRSLRQTPTYLACWKRYVEFVIWRKRSSYDSLACFSLSLSRNCSAKLEALAAELRASGGPTPESVKEFSRIYQKYGGGSANPPPAAAVVEQKEACAVM